MIWDITNNRIKLFPNILSKREHRADAKEFDSAPKNLRNTFGGAPGEDD